MSERQRAQLKGLLGNFDSTLDRFQDAPPLVAETHRVELVRLADLLRRTDEGLNGLLERMPALHDSGFFDKTPWGRLDALVPTFVSGDLAAGGHHAVLETLSCLRLIAISEGRIDPGGEHGGRFSTEEARAFLEDAAALNASALFPSETEASRKVDPLQAEMTTRLFRLIVSHLPSMDLLTLVLDELEAVAAQRPILVEGLVERIRLAARIADAEDRTDARLERYQTALDGPGPLSHDGPSRAQYLERLEKADADARKAEAEACALSVRRTGLVARHHAWLLRWASAAAPNLIDRILGLDPKGRLERHQNEALVVELIEKAVHGGTAQAVDGLGRTLERGLVSRPEVAGGLRRLVDITLDPEVHEVLQARAPEDVSPESLLLAGSLSVLGRPLGVGQGRNPTCQSARGISIWSLNRPGYLLEMVATAARDNRVRMWFLGDLLDSYALIGGLMDEMHPELDPVSLVVVPHLDRLYGEMMRRVAHRGEDGHKWVNPAMYGRMVAGGFAAGFDPLTGVPRNVRGFIERFFRTHHPDHAAAHGLTYPNPVGIIVTSAHATFVGFHAVTIQRIARDPEGTMRVYFFNPNNEGRQDWGDGVVPSVQDHGEMPGESSLPFGQFASRLYAFHYDPYWEGTGEDVTDAEVDRVMAMIERSWLRSGPWAAQMAAPDTGPV